MYEYKFVRCEAGYEQRQPVATYEPLVVEQARQGWRLVQVVILQPAAIASHYELIFERPAPA